MKTRRVLAVLLQSTSAWNAYRHETDKSKRGKFLGPVIGKGILYLFIMAYLILMTIGYSSIGIGYQAPALCFLMISLMVFILAILKVNGYLFGCKDMDLLMALPLTSKQIMQARFLYMYVKDLPGVLVVSVAMQIGFGLIERPKFFTYIVWTVLTFFAPLIPLVIATLVGTVIAGLGAGFRFKKAVTAFFTLIFVLLCFSSRFFIDSMVQNDEIDDVLLQSAELIGKIGRFYWPINWFENAVINWRVSDMLMLMGISLILIEIAFWVASKYYARINTRLKASYRVKDFKLTSAKTKSQIQTVAFNEFRHFLDSTNYLVNIGLGVIFIVIIAIAALFLDMDAIISGITQGAPVTKEMLLPAVPLVIYFFAGMVSSCAVSPSLEGKNSWILDSMPIKKIDVYKGKMLFNFLLFGPVSAVATIVVGLKCGANFIEILLFIVCILTLVLFSTCWGMVCGVKHIKLEWENDIEVIKQGSAVAIYMFPNMFAVMILVVLSVILGLSTSAIVVTVIVTVVAGLLTWLCFSKVKKLAS